jgi:hypothetical protein
MRELEKASKRVKVFTIGRSEEGRDDEANIAQLDRSAQRRLRQKPTVSHRKRCLPHRGGGSAAGA